MLNGTAGREGPEGLWPTVIVLLHLYGQSADIDPIQEACERHGVILIEDAAEALGATYKGRTPGTFGQLGIYSFNGNKIITTSGGGMLVSDDEALIAHAKKLAPKLGSRSSITSIRKSATTTVNGQLRIDFFGHEKPAVETITSLNTRRQMPSREVLGRRRHGEHAAPHAVAVAFEHKDVGVVQKAVQ